MGLLGGDVSRYWTYRRKGGGAISFRTYNIGIGRNSRLELVLRGMSQANVDGRVFQ